MKSSYTSAAAAIFITCSVIGSSALAAQQFLAAEVKRILIDETAFGGCMAFLKPGAATTGLDCPGSWVTFSCLGDFNPKSVGNQKLSAAQLALVSGTQLIVKIDDTRKHNGWCYATRVDNTSTEVQAASQ